MILVFSRIMDSFNNNTEYNISCDDLKTVGIKFTDVHVEEIIRYMTIGLVTLMFPISVCMNLIVIFLMVKFKHLRQTTYLLALQLIFVDLAYTCMISPVSIISAIAKQWILGNELCQFTGNMSGFLRTLRSFLMFVFVCDRFCTVFSPFRYPKFRKKVIITLILVSLLLSMAFAVSPIAYDCVIFNRFAWQCLNAEIGCFNEQNCIKFRIASAVINNTMGGAIPLIMYIALFAKARKIRKSTVIPVAVMPGDILETKKRERKANYTFLTLFSFTFAFIFLTLFHFLVIRRILRLLDPDSPVLAQVFVFIFRVFFDVLPILDSIAIMRNSDFRCALKKTKEVIRNRIFFK